MKVSLGIFQRNFPCLLSMILVIRGIVIIIWNRFRLTTLTTRCSMTSVFRERPGNDWLLLFSTEESEIYSEFYCNPKDSDWNSPTSISKLQETLSKSHKFQFIGRVQKKELDEFCEALTTNHHHLLLFLPQCTNAEKYRNKLFHKFCLMSNGQRHDFSQFRIQKTLWEQRRQFVVIELWL